MMLGRYLAVPDISEQAKWKLSLSMMVSLIEKPLESGESRINDLVKGAAFTRRLAVLLL